MYFIDPLYIIMVLPVFLLAIYAQVKVKRAVSKWSKVGVASRMTGAQAARRILDYNGLTDVAIEPSRGFLSDHYDPKNKTLRLSPDIYQSFSVAAVGIAAHEAGHAIQHGAGYALLKLRNAIVPTAQIGSWLAFPLIFGGFLLSIKGLALAGVALFSAIVVFQVITLPVELDASRRAKKIVADMGLVQTSQESAGVASVLNAAAMTYVAATISALVQLLYFALRLGILGGDD